MEKIPTTSVHPEIYAQGIHIDGINNAGKISDHLYRGSQPNARGLQELKKLGVTTIVDLRGELQKKRDWESKQAESLGMRFVVIPGDGWSPPTDEQIGQFFALVSEKPRQTIFIHCWFGTDRTGVFVAAYRLAFQHWTPEQAIAEMYEFHFKGFWHPAMKSYIRTFPARLSASPALALYRAIEEASTPPASLLRAFLPVLRYQRDVTSASFSRLSYSPMLLVNAQASRRTEEAHYSCKSGVTQSWTLLAQAPTAG